MNNLLNSVANILRRLNGYRFPPLGGIANTVFFALMPERFQADLFPGITATLNKKDLTQRTTYWQGDRFEKPTPHILRSWITADTTHFFDIGSNFGFFSYWMLSQSPTLTTHAFEPNPTTFALVQSIKEKNHLSRLYPWNIGLSDCCDTLALHPGVEDSGHSTFGKHPELHGSTIANIPVKPFSVWLKEQNIELPQKPSWIAKIDVEGYEMHVLKGMEEVLRAKAFQGLVVEANPYTLEFCNSSQQEILDFMVACGYQRLEESSSCGNYFFIPA